MRSAYSPVVWDGTMLRFIKLLIFAGTVSALTAFPR
jgi:hypothetical protein